MRNRSVLFLLLGVAVGFAGLVACDIGNPLTPSDASIGAASGTGGAASGKSKSPQLNLSHIECVDGQVEVHFVLLHVAGGVIPGTLTYTYGSIEPGPHTGNVWHYTDYLASGGTYNVTSASVDVDGTTVQLHNPGEYAGTYDCSTQSCPLPDPEALFCSSVLGSPESECGFFDLDFLSKDDDLSGSTHVASRDADLALVKDGRGPCAQGENAYRTYTSVQQGDILEQPLGAGDISHVTYCGCPA